MEAYFSHTDSPAPRFSVYDISTASARIDARIFWARLVSGDQESLLTQDTKHTFYEIQYALEGELRIQLGNRTLFRIPQGSFLVVPPDTFHQITDPADSVSRFVLAFSVSAADSSILQALKALHTPTVYTPADDTLLSLILHRSDPANPVQQHSLGALLEAFLLELLSVAAEQFPPGGTHPGENEPASQRVAQICAYIQSCHGIRISVEEVARRFSVSPRHLNRLLRSVSGKSPREIINHEKLIKLEEYLVSTDLSFSEIAVLCGFCDVYAMSKFFKRYTKTSPSDFKRLAKKK